MLLKTLSLYYCSTTLHRNQHSSCHQEFIIYKIFHLQILRVKCIYYLNRTIGVNSLWSYLYEFKLYKEAPSRIYCRHCGILSCIRFQIFIIDFCMLLSSLENSPPTQAVQMSDQCERNHGEGTSCLCHPSPARPVCVQ